MMQTFLLFIALLAPHLLAQTETEKPTPVTYRVDIKAMKAFGVPGIPPGTRDHFQVWSYGWGSEVDTIRVQIDVLVKGTPRSFFEYVKLQNGKAFQVFYFDNISDVQLLRTIATRVNLGESYIKEENQ